MKTPSVYSGDAYTAGDYAIFTTGQMKYLVVMQYQTSQAPTLTETYDLRNTVGFEYDSSTDSLYIEEDPTAPEHDDSISHQINNNNEFVGLEFHNSTKCINATGVLISDVLDVDPTRFKFLSAPLSEPLIGSDGTPQEIVAVHVTLSTGHDLTYKVFFKAVTS